MKTVFVNKTTNFPYVIFIKGIMVLRLEVSFLLKFILAVQDLGTGLNKPSVLS